MTAIQRLTVAFPEPLAAELKEAVKTGEYATTSEAVRDAVRLWSARRGTEEADVDRLRAAWADGIASGDDGLLDMAAIIEEARAEASRDR